jgi:hexosaminidase
MLSRLAAALAALAALAPAAPRHRPLLPRPQRVEYCGGQLALHGVSVQFASAPVAEDWFAAGELASALSAIAYARIAIGGNQASSRAIILRRTGALAPLPEKDERPGRNSREAYRLRITPGKAELEARSSAGIYYGVQTIRQLVEGNGAAAALPCVEIEDWPSLAYRGVMMDLSHGPMPTIDEIKRQIDFLSRWKGNQYYFYSEASIELTGYPLINPGARYSQKQVREVIDYARVRHVDVVPCLELYGHLHDVFRVERYADLSALPHGGEINPHQARIQAMIRDWVGQMAGLFSSPWFHIGLDEPWELGKASNSEAEAGRLYIRHLRDIAELAGGRGKRVMFWADVNNGAEIFKRYPQLVSDLPRDVVAVPWEYEALPDFTPYLEPFPKVGLATVVGTGIWAWEDVTPDFERTFANIDSFLSAGRKFGTLGIVNTNWADDAQILFRMTLPGIAYGAAAAWQSSPMDRPAFFNDYSTQMYVEPAAPDVAEALADLSHSQKIFLGALGEETMFRLWDDPLEPARLERVEARRDELRKGRLLAENAQEKLLRALEKQDESYSLPSLLLGARMLDYLGMKYIYACEIAAAFRTLGRNPSSADLEFHLQRHTSSRNHSRVADLMDTIGGLREEYRRAWESEHLPYRMPAALGRWDAEYEYWRRLQARFWDYLRNRKDKDPLPPLESFRTRS